MKLFLLKLISLLLLITLSTGLMKFLLPSKKTYNSAFIDKLELVKKNKNQRKILLIGGSSIGWGVSAEQIEKATNITTINLGHHAGFGLVDFQDFLLSCLTPDDLIIFCPEWFYYNNPNAYDTATLNNLLQNSAYLDLTNKPLATRLRSIFLKKISFSEDKDKSSPYVYKCINQNGDIISHCGLKPEGPKKYSVDFDSLDLKTFTNTFKYISTVRCILLFPPTQESVYLKDKKSFEKLQAVISQSKLTFIDSIKSNIYHESDFFDQNYHLKCDVITERTKKVIQYISKNIILPKNVLPN